MGVKVVATPCLQFPHSQPSVSQSSLFNTNINSLCTKRASNDTVFGCRFATSSFKLHRRRCSQFIPRACISSFDGFSDEEFSKKIEDLTFRFENTDENITFRVSDLSIESQLLEMKANRVDLPLSLRMIKRKLKKKQQWKDEFIEASESAYCSVKKAFSSMVFIIRELHSYSLQMREVLFYEDLKGILERVEREIHASFVWLFQQVFSHTPILMVSVMILLANFTVHSISTPTAVAAVTPAVSVTEMESSALTSMVSFSDGGNTAFVGGGEGGGGKTKAVASGMEEEGWEEIRVWNSIVEEASRMEGGKKEEMFVSPVKVKIEEDGEYEEYFRTDLVYQMGLAHEPNNVMLLANYAQFLCLVAHDYDRAEEYFKRAIKIEPKDAEAHNKYANFLWQVRNDLWAAEEIFQEAISADPSNSYYAANYAHFLWNTGGEDTCFPLSSLDDDESID